jgi:hypothetical protein
MRSVTCGLQWYCTSTRLGLRVRSHVVPPSIFCTKYRVSPLTASSVADPVLSVCAGCRASIWFPHSSVFAGSSSALPAEGSVALPSINCFVVGSLWVGSWVCQAEEGVGEIAWSRHCSIASSSTSQKQIIGNCPLTPSTTPSRCLMRARALSALRGELRLQRFRSWGWV